MVDTPFGSFEPVRDSGARYVDVAAVLDGELPAFKEAAGGATYELLALATLVVGDRPTHAAVRVLFGLAVNDFRDLLDELSRGAGRPAIRTARSLIEHAINMNVIAGDLAEASRYMEHLHQGAAILADLEPGAGLVERANKKVGRSYRHALRKFGTEAKRRFERAVAHHGSWFRTKWTPVSLRDRAKSCGLEPLYAYYQLASFVVHGSAGGTLGTVRSYFDGRTTTRTGPALELAPVAMMAGLDSFRAVLEGLATARPDLEPAEYSSGLDALTELWADYFLVLNKVDRDLWPTERQDPPCAVLTFAQTRERRWYLHVPTYGVLIPAEAPVLSAEMDAQIEKVIDHGLTEQHHLFRSDQRWLTARIDNVGVKVRSGASAIPDTAFLQTRPEGGWEFRPIDDDDEI